MYNTLYRTVFLGRTMSVVVACERRGSHIGRKLVGFLHARISNATLRDMFASRAVALLVVVNGGFRPIFVKVYPILIPLILNSLILIHPILPPPILEIPN